MIKSSILIVLLLIITSYAVAQDRLTGKSFATRSEVMAQHGMAATSQPLATQAAIDVLKKGGSAVDAAIAANAVLGVVEPAMNGIGGDLFAIVYEAKTGKLYGLNASGRSPGSLTLDSFSRRGLTGVPLFGVLSVSVPGCVDGWFELHKKFGSLKMKDILSYAIGYARNGFAVADEAAYYWARLPALHRSRPNLEIYLPGGAAPKRGEVFRNPQLAGTLQKIAAGGRDVFYKGEIAKSIDAFMKREGGFLSSKDLAEHHSDWIDPVSTTYRGYKVWELPPNGQGIAALEMLNILEGFDFSKIAFGSAEHVHLVTEAKKLAFEDRARYYADMDFAKVPVNWLISKEYAASRRKLINPDKAADTVYAGEDLPNSGETVYLTVADSAGNMVSLIQSNFDAFGSGVIPDGLGFVLQNRSYLFTLEKGRNNTYAPRKRPFHTIIPAFVTKDGKPFMSFGVMGGSFQPQGHVQILMNMIDFGMNGQEAGDAPRFDHTGSSDPTGKRSDGIGRIGMESGFSYETQRALSGMGHLINFPGPGGYGGYQAIRYDPVSKVYFGASDPRKDGMAAGY